MAVFLNSNCYLLLSQIKKKKVKFTACNTILIIPNKDDIKEDDTHLDLWWSKEDLKAFLIEAQLEFQDIIQRHPGITRADMFKLLYNTGNITFDENNFV